MSSIETFKDLNFDIIKINSFNLKSAHDNAIKKVGIPNCFTIAKTSCIIFFPVYRSTSDGIH